MRAGQNIFYFNEYRQIRLAILIASVEIVAAGDREDMSATEILKSWLSHKGREYTQKRLAIEAELSQASISMIVRGRNKNPDTDTIEKIASALGVSMAEFWAGPEEYQRSLLHNPGRPETVLVDLDMSRIPLLTSIPAGDWKTWVDDYPAGFGEGTVPRFGVPGEHTFALAVDGDSMIPDLYPGDLLIINPDVPFTRLRGGIGVVRLGDGYKIRKVYQMDGDTYRLEPSNRAHGSEIIPVADTTIFKVALWIPAQHEKMF